MRKSFLSLSSKVAISSFVIGFSSLLVLSLSLPNQASTKHRGCNPRTDKSGCADKGAPVNTGNKLLLAGNPSRGYLFLADGCAKTKDWHECGFVDNSVRVGDWTNMRPQKKYSKDFPKEMTFEIAEMD